MRKKKRIRSDVVRDSVNTFGTNAIGAVLVLIANFITMQRVNPTIKGYYNAMQMWGGGFNTIFGLSIASAVVYFVARHTIGNAERAVKRVTTRVFLLIAVAGTLILIGTRALSMFHFDEMPVDFLVAIVVYALASLVFSVCTCVLRGENKFKSFNIVNLTQNIANTLLYIYIAARPSAVVWIWGTNAISIGMIGFSLYCIRRWNGPRPKPAPEDDHPVGSRDFVKYSLKSHVSNMLAYVNIYFGNYLVQDRFAVADLGVYSAATVILDKIWILPNAVGQVVMSRIAAMTERKDKVRLTLISTKAVTYVTAVIALLVLWAAKIFIPLLFPMYVGAIAPLRYLIVGAIVISYAKVLGNSIAAYGRPELNILPTVVGIASNIAASFLFVPEMGVNGVALATSISLSAQGVACIAIFCRFSRTPFYRLLLPSREEIAMARAAFRK